VFALDTNTVIYYFKGAGSVAERLLATPPHDVALPGIVVYELERGVLRSGNAPTT
jgi:tRNA(fMet)-specific endonuclease VapC